MRIEPKEHYPWYLRLFFWFEKKRYGQTLLPAKIWGYSPRALLSLATFYQALARKRSPLSPELRSLISLRVSELNHCPFCIDFNTFRQRKEISLTPEINAALAYAEAITSSEVTDEIFATLKSYYSDNQIVELTGLITLQICSSKFNTALQIPSQEFCK